MLKFGSSIIDCLFQKTFVRSKSGYDKLRPRKKCSLSLSTKIGLINHDHDMMYVVPVRTLYRHVTLGLNRGVCLDLVNRSLSEPKSESRFTSTSKCLSRFKPTVGSLLMLGEFNVHFQYGESFLELKSRPCFTRTFNASGISLRWITTSRSCSYKNNCDDSMTHYEILDIKCSATSDEIRDAFLKLSKQYHPDINQDPNNHKQFVRINEAYSVLNRPLARKDYDLTLDAERYLKQRRHSSAHRSHSYGYSGESGHYYYHRSYVHEEGFSSNFNQEQEFNPGKRLHHGLVNFLSVTAVLTIATVAFILQSMYSLYPNMPKKNIIHRRDISSHDLIMTSEHNGRTVFYYAIPDKKDPLKFEIWATAKKENEENSEELEVLNCITKSKLVTVEDHP